MSKKSPQRFQLSPSTRSKLAMAAGLLGDLVEDIVQEIMGADGETPPVPRRPGTVRKAYRPERPVSDVDRKKAEQLLASQGYVKRGS